MPGGDYRDALRERAGWAPEAGPLLDVDGERVGEHGGTAGYTVGQRQGLGVALGEPRYVVAHRPADQHDHARPPRGSRDARRSPLERATFVAGDAPDGDGRVPGRDPDPPSADAGPRDASGPTRAPRRRWTARPTGRCGPPRPARRPCSTTARSCSAAGGSRGRRRWRRRHLTPAPTQDGAGIGGLAPGEHRPGARPRVLVGIFNAALYVLIRGQRRRPPADHRGRGDPRRVGRGRARRPARARPPADRRLPPGGGVARGLVGIAISSAVAILGPSQRRA